MAVAVGVIVAMGTRAALLPWSGNEAPFLFAFPVVAIIALMVGSFPALITAALCAVWAWVPWAPVNAGAGSSALFLISAGALVAVIRRLAPSAQLRRWDAQEPDSAPASDAHRRILATTQWILLVAASLPTLVYLGVAAYQYDRAYDDASVRLDRAARIAAEHATKVFETNEMLLRRVFDALGADDDAALVRREPELHRKLKTMVADLPHVQSIWVWDAFGHPLLSNRFLPAPRELDVSDREFFRWHRDNRGGGLFITEALVARATGDVFSDMSLRRDRADATYGGLISVGLHVDHFSDFYAELAKAEPGLVVSLVRRDGRWIARWPFLPPPGTALDPEASLMQAIAADRVSGLIESTSAADAVQRIFAYRRVGTYPVYVAAGVSRAAVVSAWRREVGLLGLFAVPAALGLIALAWLAMRRAQMGVEAVERLDAESAQRQRAEEALRQAQKLEAMGRLTGGVAHDFNNLLAVVNNNLYLHRRLNREVADSEQLAAIERAVQGGTHLTRQLLAFSRRQPELPEVVSLQQRLPTLLALVKPLVTAQVEMSAQVAPDTAAIRVDWSELELALINLVVNARDAMPDGGRLAIAARNAPPGEPAGFAGDFVLLEVSDTGEGIPPELVERVFEPFFTTKRVSQGTGLGLSQVYGTSLRAGGTTQLVSRVGAGTTVRMYFPALHGVEPTAAVEAGEVPAKPGCRVLLVEDNPPLAEVTQQLLETLGCTVRRVSSADEAIGCIERGDASVDVVLSDISMPGSLDGIALGSWIRANRPDVGVVLMTGYAERLDHAVALGLNVLPKPCSPDALSAALRAATVGVGSGTPTPASPSSPRSAGSPGSPND